MMADQHNFSLQNLMILCILLTLKHLQERIKRDAIKLSIKMVLQHLVIKVELPKNSQKQKARTYQGKNSIIHGRKNQNLQQQGMG
jgi:hypothetical protein